MKEEVQKEGETMTKHLKKAILFIIFMLTVFIFPSDKAYASNGFLHPFIEFHVSLESSQGTPLPTQVTEKWLKENTLQLKDSKGNLIKKTVENYNATLNYLDLPDDVWADAGKSYSFSGNLAIPEGYDIEGISHCRSVATQGDYDEVTYLDLPVDFDIQKNLPVYTLDEGLLQRMSKYPSSTPNGKGSCIDVQLTIALKKKGESRQMNHAVLEIPQKEYPYTGKAITPKGIKVRFSTGRYSTEKGGLLKEGVDYKLKYTNNTKSGTATVQAIGIGKWKGSTSTRQEWCHFKIIPSKDSTELRKGQVKTVGTGVYKILTLGKNTGTVEYKAPKSSKYKTVKINSKVKIQNKVFTVTSIGSYAFKNNKNLSEVTVGKNVKYIKKGAFLNCSKLKKIHFTGNNLTKVEQSVLKGISSKAIIKVPAAKQNAYAKLFKGKGQAKTVKIVK